MNTIEDQFPTLQFLRNIFQYAFIETKPYYFMAPRPDRFTAVRIEEKAYRCTECGGQFTVRFKQDGPVYMENVCWEAQRDLYAQLGMPFPAAGEALVYQATGLCETCFAALPAQTPQQKIYQLCDRLLETDLQFYQDASAFAAQTCGPRLAERIEAYAEAARAGIAAVRAQLDLLDQATFTACVGRPVHIYESVAAKWYNEYTTLFPRAGTAARPFYTETELERKRVYAFIEQPRIFSLPRWMDELQNGRF